MEMKQLTSEREAVDQLREEINAVLGKRWMVAIWCADEVGENGKPDLVALSGRTTWCFPKSGFEEAIRLLSENLEVEQKTDTLSVPGPLEMAPFVVPAKDMGKADDKKCSELLLGDMLRKNRDGK